MTPATLGFAALSILAGAFIPIQTGYNAELARALKSPLLASTIVFLAASQPFLTRDQATAVPAFAWVAGGVLAATYIVILSLAAPALGSATTVVFVVLGQILCSLVIDHFGLLHFPVHALSWPRLAGVALLVSGVGLIKAF